MIRKNKINGKLICIEAKWLLLFFLSFFFVSSPAQVQHADSLQVDTTDSTARMPLDTLFVQDSLAREYVFLSENRSNPLLDSIRALITVEGNDFVAWMQRMEALQNDRDTPPPAKAVYKNTRPAWILVVMLLLFLGIGLVRFVFRSAFQNIIQAYYNEQVTQDISKEDSLVTSWPYIFLYVLFSMSLGLFLLIYISAFGDSAMLTVENFFSLSAFVAVVFIVKILFIRLIAAIFELQRVAREYITVLYLMYFNTMLILMPFLLIVTFSPVEYFNILLILFAVIAAGLFIYKFILTAFRLLGQLKFSIFYLILYLCALEIAPILILIKALNS